MHLQTMSPSARLGRRSAITSLFELQRVPHHLTGIRDPATGINDPEIDITTASSAELAAEEETTTLTAGVVTHSHSSQGSP